MKRRLSVVSQLVDGSFKVDDVLGPIIEDINKIDYK